MRNRSGLKLITAAVLFVAFASISFAQQPAGALQAVDSGNRVVGPVCGDGNGPSAMVCRQVNGLLFRLPLAESGFGSQADVYFTSSDCTPPAYMVSSSNIYPGVNVFGNSALVENVSAPVQTLTVNSWRTAAGACELLPAPASMDNMRASLEFTGYSAFVPPFVVRGTSAAPPIEAVDGNNRVVGQLCADGDGSPAMLCYQVDYLAFRLPMSRTGFINNDEIFFSGTACTSQAAVIPRGGIYPAAMVAGSSAFVEDIASPLQGFTANSKRDVSGACVLLPVPTAMNNMSAARELPNFNTFVAPFRLHEAGADTEAPQPPAALSATATSESQVSLSWMPSLDNVGVAGYQLERCAGVGCTNFTLAASPSGISFSDTGLTPSTTYNYRVRALDSATPANVSGYSNTAPATTQAPPAPPAAPGNLTVTGANSARIVLAWTAPQAFAATEYHLERCKGNGCANFAEVAVATGVTYTDEHRQVDASYTYRVRARNTAGTFTGYSNIVVGTAAIPEGGRARDIVVAMDGSGSVTSAGWTVEKNFVADLVNSAIPFENGVGVGVVVFSGVASAPVPLNLLTSASAPDIVSTVTGLTFPNSNSTATLSGVQKALTEFETRGYGQSEKYLFVITDGNPNPADTQNPCGTTAAAADARARLAALDVNGVLVAVGPDINPTTLGCLYDYDPNRVFKAADFTEVQFQSILATADAYFFFASTGIPTFPAVNPATLSSGQVNLTWAPSIDDDFISAYVIERCTGTQCSSLVQIGSVAGNVLSYSDATVQAGLTYTYYIDAVDSEGNSAAHLGLEPVASITIPDTTPPSPPSALTATPSASGAITLNWTASTDDGVVAQYRVERCTGLGCSNFTQITTVTGLTFTNTSLANNTSYSFRVRAADAAGNLGGYSNTATATATVDTQPPTTPTNLVAASAGASSISLSWTASTDASGIDKYRIERCGGSGCTSFAQIGTATDTTFLDSNATANTDFRYRVRAQDIPGNLSPYSNIARADRPDTAPPTAPTNLTATLQVTTVNLSWTASTDGFAVANYSIERCAGVSCSDFAVIGTSTAAAYSDGSAASGTTYRYRVSAIDAAGNRSASSNTAAINTDVVPPSTPVLTVTQPGPATLDAQWTSSTDDVGVTAYTLERCTGATCTNFAVIATLAASASEYNDSGTGGTTYRYRVRASDGVNFSSYSNVVTISLSFPPPQNPPTNLSSSIIASRNTYTLTWTASPDQGVVEYSIERCAGSGCTDFVQIATASQSPYDGTYSSTGVYRFRVRGVDALGNATPPSNIVTLTFK